jgi:hypothetical protein
MSAFEPVVYMALEWDREGGRPRSYVRQGYNR